MKKLLKKVKDVAEVALLGGVNTLKNSDSSDSPLGKTPKAKAIGGILSSVALILLLIALISGKLSLSDFLDLFKQLQN